MDPPLKMLDGQYLVVFNTAKYISKQFRDANPDNSVCLLPSWLYSRQSLLLLPSRCLCYDAVPQELQPICSRIICFDQGKEIIA